MISLLLATSLLMGAAPAPLESPAAEIVDPETYAIKRFNEVVSLEMEAENIPLQERLIALRAKLSIAERRLEDMKTGVTTSPLGSSDSLPAVNSDGAPPLEKKPFKPQMLKALTARIDYYRRVIDSFEQTILAEKQKAARTTAKKR